MKPWLALPVLVLALAGCSNPDPMPVAIHPTYHLEWNGTLDGDPFRQDIPYPAPERPVRAPVPASLGGQAGEMVLGAPMGVLFPASDTYFRPDGSWEYVPVHCEGADCVAAGPATFRYWMDGQAAWATNTTQSIVSLKDPLYGTFGAYTPELGGRQSHVEVQARKAGPERVLVGGREVEAAVVELDLAWLENPAPDGRSEAESYRYEGHGRLLLDPANRTEITFAWQERLHHFAHFEGPGGLTADTDFRLAVSMARVGGT